MFRPAALSPNTLIPDHQGLDYFVFPDVFKSAVSDEADKLIRAERDKFFSRAPKFGPQWLRQMQQIPAFLLDLQLDRASEAETCLQPTTGSRNPLPNDSRTVSAADQVLRFTSWPMRQVDSAGSDIPGSLPARDIPSVKTEAQSEDKDSASAREGPGVTNDPRSGAAEQSQNTSTRLHVSTSRSRQASRFSVNREHLRNLTDSK